MGIRNSFARGACAAALLCVASLAHAAPVTLNFEGRVTGYDYIDLGSFFPVGSNVSLSLTFNETFTDGTYTFADDLGPVSGSMTVGSTSFTFDGYTPWSYQYDLGTGDVTFVNPRFTGTGPTLGGGDFFGMYAAITPALTLASDLLLGYGFTTVYDDGFTITSYGYAKLTADRYSITPAAVPEPSTLALFAVGCLLALVGARRRTGIAHAC